MPPVLTEKLMGLPRWAWALMLAGGVGIGLYLRSHEGGSSNNPELETSETSGNLVPPAGAIEGSGGGGGGGATEISKAVAPQPESVKPEAVEPAREEETGEEVELPESRAPEPQVIATAGQGRKEPVRGESISAKHPGKGIGEGVKVAGPDDAAEKQKRANEINRLQSEIGNLRSENERLNGEINDLQNSINTLTGYIQAHPRATQKGQWENERNQDRSNIESKRSKVDQNNSNISHKQDEMTYWSAH